jgi:hypothetical protein
MGRFVKNPKLDNGALSQEIPQVTTAQRPQDKTGNHLSTLPHQPIKVS